MKKYFLISPIVFALIFVFLFKGQQAGLNVFLFNLLLLGGIYWSGRLIKQNRFQLLFSSGALLSAIMVVVHGSTMAMAANIFSLILLLGFVAATDMKLLINGFTASVFALITAPYQYFKDFTELTGQKSSGRKLLRFILVIIAPIVALLIFTTLYASASPYFNKLTGGLIERLADFFEVLMRFISPAAFWLFIAGFLIFIAFLSGKSNRFLLLFSEKAGMQLFRTRQLFSGRMNSLKTEYRSGVVMLVLLNLLLAVMNGLDIYNVWFFFEWNGLYLKQFVHEGTWLLIFSIIISIFIVLYYFRANLNFYPKRGLLLNLAMIWMVQNAILVISVGVRNMWYIHHFNLAYKRIGVYAFLLLTLFGIATVIFKIRQRKTHQYLFHYNGIAAYVILIGLGFFNWDKIIASFNVQRSEKAFFHPEFMITLNSSALPALKRSTEQIDKIRVAQEGKFDYYREYMALDYYKEKVEERCADFTKGYNQISWQGWNYADYQAYKSLKARDNPEN
ncbi:MAG: DUF4173 domain-containing protein [Lentimicrobium sp.]|nr:DUF4173 domain-containing protein [Lentimicrobium sp.]